MHTFPCQPATRPSSGENNQHQYNQGHQDEPQSPHLSYFMKQYSYTYILPSLCTLGCRTAPWVFYIPPLSVEQQWSGSLRRFRQRNYFDQTANYLICAELSVAPRGCFCFIRGREQVHVMLWIPMQEEVKEGRMMGGKKFLAQEEEVLFVSLRRGGKWGETSRWICGYVLSLFERRVIIWRVEWQGANGHLHKRSKTFYTERHMCDRGHGGKVSLT